MQGYIGAYYLRTEPRKYLRLSKYHYRMSGYYYITLCTQNRQCLFGTIENNDMVLNEAGQMIHNLWLDIGNLYYGFKNDVFVVMPNHLHGILMICEHLYTMYPVYTPCAGPIQYRHTGDDIRVLYTFMDYLFALPEDLEEVFIRKMKQHEKEVGMEYITSAERIGIKKGIEKGIEKGMAILLLDLIKNRFPFVPQPYINKIEQADDDMLRKWGMALLQAKNLEDIFNPNALSIVEHSI